MSAQAMQAVLSAAAENATLKAQLGDPSTFDDTVSQILSLTDSEKQTVMDTLGNEDTSAPQSEDAEERNNPGPGSTGIGAI